jgi:hypothetical protein
MVNGNEVADRVSNETIASLQFMFHGKIDEGTTIEMRCGGKLLRITNDGGTYKHRALSFDKFDIALQLLKQLIEPMSGDNRTELISKTRTLLVQEGIT